MSSGIISSELDHLTLGEQRKFAEAQKAGLVTFFQVGACATCSKDIPKVPNKKYCSEQCKKAKENATIATKDDSDGEVD